MKMKINLIACLLLIPILWFGCAVQRQVVRKPPETKKNRHYFTEIQSIGDQGFQAELQYDTNEGFMKIIFLDGSKSKAIIIDAKKVKALMLPDNGAPRQFYFYNPKKFGRHNYSFIGEREPQHYVPTNFLYVRKDWLKNLSSFTLKIWIPIEEVTYQVEYEYPKKEGVIENILRLQDLN